MPRKTRLNLEPLETRYAPATLVNPFTVTYRDEDQDIVTVKFSKPILEQATINNVFDFSVGDVSGVNSQPQQLELIDLTALANPQAAKGASISITAVRGQASGDGFANVGRINATGIDLGAVNVKGDLADIDVGNTTTPGTALVALTVQSMGRFGLSTGATDTISELFGPVGKLVVKTDVKEILIDCDDPSTTLNPVGSIFVGGSLIGGGVAQRGQIITTGNVGSVRIGGDLVGGSEVFTGRIDFGNAATIGAVSIGGSLFGGSGGDSGQVNQNSGTMASLRIRGSLFGGTVDDAGSCQLAKVLGPIFVGGSLFGGIGFSSGAIRMSDDIGGPVQILGNLVGGLGDQSGRISISGKLASFKLGGSIFGGGGEKSGCIDDGSSALTGLIQIAGDIRGGGGERSGTILSAGPVKTIKIGGSVRSGIGLQSGSIISERQIGSLTVTGSLHGTAADPVFIAVRDPVSGLPATTPLIGKLTVLGSVEFAQILAGYDDNDLAPNNGDGSIGTVSVRGDWIASSLVAGVDDGADNKFGTNDDFLIAGHDPNVIAKIASITIGGMVYGTVGGTDQFAFVAEHIVSLSVGGTVISLTAGPGSDALGLGALGTTDDVQLLEI